MGSWGTTKNLLFIKYYFNTHIKLLGDLQEGTGSVF